MMLTEWCKLPYMYSKVRSNEMELYCPSLNYYSRCVILEVTDYQGHYVCSHINMYKMLVLELETEAHLITYKNVLCTFLHKC